MPTIRQARWVALFVSLLTWSARAETNAALARLESAEARYVAALSELRAAEAELNAAREAASTAVGVRDSAATNKSTTVAHADPAPAAAPPPAVEEKKEPGFFDWDTWKKTIAFGLDGSSGNSDRLTGHLKLTFDRNDKKTKTHLDALYRNAERDGTRSENSLRLNFRHDWLAQGDSRWIWWAKGTYEYDDFKPWQHRVSAHAGFGYNFIKKPDTTLGWRAGLGGTQTYGGTADEFRPEALLTGVDFTKKIKEGQKLTAGTELFVDVSDKQEIRVNTSVDYEIMLDKEAGMLFRLGVDHRYDSRPGSSTASRSDFDYYLSLGWKF